MPKRESFDVVSPGMDKQDKKLDNGLKKGNPDVQKKQDDFKKKKDSLIEKKTREKEKKDASVEFERDAAGGVMPPGHDQIKTAEIQVLSHETQEAEKIAVNSLREKHDIEIEATIKSFDIDGAEPSVKKALYKESLVSSVDLNKVSDADKKKALEGLKGPDGKEIDIAKLTPVHKFLIQQNQAEKYLKSLATLSEKDKKDPKKLQELSKDNLGISDFSNKKNVDILTEESFFEALKNDPSKEALRSVIESVQKYGTVASGIDPKSKLGESLTKIAQGNIDEYREMFPEETDVKKFADILGGSYFDVLAGIPFANLGGFEDSLQNTKESLKSGELGGIVREDYKTEKDYQDALNKAAKEATGVDYQKLTSAIGKIQSSGNLHPFIKFLLNIFAPIGATLGGEIGEKCRSYLREQNGGQDVSGGGFDKGGKKFEKLGSTTPDALIKSAEKYLGWPYKYGADGSSKEKGIDCSQLVVNSLIDEGCLPKGFDTTAMGFAQRSHRVADNQGKKGDFLIMGEPSPHIAIITADPAPGSNTYKTIEAASGKGGVVHTQRTAGNSFHVYKNPFFEGNSIAQNKQGTEKFNMAGMAVTVIPPAYPKNLSDRNKNPLNIKSSQFPGDAKGHSICPSYEAGITIAVQDLEKKFNGQSGAVREYTARKYGAPRDALYVRDVIGTWAPESDGNNPDEYTRTVLSKMGFSGDYNRVPIDAVKNRIPELVVQMAKFEGCQATFQVGGGK